MFLSKGFFRLSIISCSFIRSPAPLESVRVRVSMSVCVCERERKRERERERESEREIEMANPVECTNDRHADNGGWRRKEDANGNAPAAPGVR